MIDNETMDTMNRRVIAEFRARGGIVGGEFADVPILLLHHVGARSGTRRTNPLAYRDVDTGFAVFASNGGGDAHPGWYHNLVAQREAQVEVGTRRIDVAARITGGEERERIWAQQKVLHPVFAELEQATARTIPVVVLEPTGRGNAPPLDNARVAATDVPTVVEPLFREYGEWVAGQLRDDAGIIFTAADLDRHHEAFRAELPRLLGARGRLLVARVGDEPVGVGALKPIDDATAEVKRMFVRPDARGQGIGRALLERLVDDARDEDYETVRLETLRFMTAALAMYRSFGFVEVPVFHGSETAATPLEPLTIAMEHTIGARGRGGDGER